MSASKLSVPLEGGSVLEEQPDSSELQDAERVWYCLLTMFPKFSKIGRLLPKPDILASILIGDEQEKHFGLGGKKHGLIQVKSLLFSCWLIGEILCGKGAAQKEATITARTIMANI